MSDPKVCEICGHDMTRVTTNTKLLNGSYATAWKCKFCKQHEHLR